MCDMEYISRPISTNHAGDHTSTQTYKDQALPFHVLTLHINLVRLVTVSICELSYQFTVKYSLRGSI